MWFSLGVSKTAVSLPFFLSLHFASFAALTHTVTHTGIRTETAGYLLVGSSSRFMPSDPHLHHLIHEISHLFCCLFLFLAGGMGVGA